MQDLPVNLDEITELKDSSAFKLIEKTSGTYPHEQTLIYGVRIVMGKDLIVIERTGYTILDFLSDVGGLQGILVFLMTLVMNLFNRNRLSTFMIERLFRVQVG